MEHNINRKRKVDTYKLEATLTKIHRKDTRQANKRQRSFDEGKASVPIPAFGHPSLLVHHGTRETYASIDTLLLPATLSKEDHLSLTVCNGRNLEGAGKDGRRIGYLMGLEGYELEHQEGEPEVEERRESGLLGREFGEWQNFSIQTDAPGTELNQPQEVQMGGPLYVYVLM